MALPFRSDMETVMSDDRDGTSVKFYPSGLSMDCQSWRCRQDDAKFCPPEGCPAKGPGERVYGCARDYGWTPDKPSPPECQGNWS
jgi:hypothetical protein